MWWAENECAITQHWVKVCMLPSTRKKKYFHLKILRRPQETELHRLNPEFHQ